MFYNLSATLFSSSTLQFFILSRKIPNLTKIKVCTYLPHICDEEQKINNTNQECLLNDKWEDWGWSIYQYYHQTQPVVPSCSSKQVFRNIHRKTSVLKSLFNKVAGHQNCNFIKKRLQQRCFPVKFSKLLRTLFLQNMSHRTCSVKLFLFLSPYSSDTLSKQEVVPSHENK